MCFISDALEGQKKPVSIAFLGFNFPCFCHLTYLLGCLLEVAPGRVLRHGVDSPGGAALKTRTSGQFIGKEVLL